MSTMASALISQMNFAIRRIEQIITMTIFRQFPPESFCLATINETNYQPNPRFNDQPRWSLKEIFDTGFLWAVPKHRRTIERRLKRKFGSPEYVVKILKPKPNLRICDTCGHDYEIGVLCPHCYKNVRLETEAMQEQIQAELKLDPVEKDVIVLYDGEKLEEMNSNEFYKNTKVIEMKKPRPAWFSKNLLQKTTQPLAETKDVKPTELG